MKDIKQFFDFHTFKKAVRKYWKRYAIKSTSKRKSSKKLVFYWTTDIWCYYLLNDKSELNRTDIRPWFAFDISDEDFDANKDAWGDLFNKKVKISSSKINGVGTFLGFAILNNGVQFAFADYESDNEKAKFIFLPLYVKIEEIC